MPDRGASVLFPAQSRGTSIARQRGLKRIGCIVRGVRPRGFWRKAHQHTLRPSIGLQTEVGATVMQQVEFHIAPASAQLKLPLGFAVWRVSAALDERRARSGQ